MIAPELSRLVAADRVGAGGLERVVEASRDECAALARRLAIPDVLAVACRFRLHRGGDEARGEILADGALTARLVRECVLTLEPFEAVMNTAFSLRFVHAGSERDDELDPEDDDEVPYEGGAIDLGEATAEQLALELDPYPRRPGVLLAEGYAPDAPDVDEAPASPFAALRGRTGARGAE